MKSLFVLPILFFTSVFVFAQDEYTWWNLKHNWDGHTPWTDYIIASPGKMGPNALPVPEVRGAEIGDSAYIKIRYDQHGGFGDNTQNAFTEIYFPIKPKRVAFNVWGVPVEYFKMDSITRDERFARHYSGKGFAAGDVYFSSLINFLKEGRVLPSATLECIIKTASGNNLSNARYTDSPGYVFTVHTSKTIYQKEQYTYSINFNTGFYAWQTNKFEHRQNDAFLYGFAIKLSHPLFFMSSGLRGYYGYLNDGDRPVVAFANAGKNFGRWQFSVDLQYGINDYPYQTVRFGFSYYPTIFKKAQKFYTSVQDD